MYKVLIVGFGSIGFRYFQAINRINLSIKLFIFDKNKQVKKKISDKNNKINFTNNFNQLPNKVDLVILSTTANGRVNLVNKLINKTNFKYAIIEKPLTQSKNELDKLNKIVDNKIVWVNTDRRGLKLYRDIKKNLDTKKKIIMRVKGNSWGICCNSLHFVDLFNYLCNHKITNIYEKKKLKWISSKRKNFYDLDDGILKIEYNNHDLYLESFYNKKNNINLSITIQNNYKKFYITEKKNLLYLKHNSKTKCYKNLLLSIKMTNIIYKILEKGKSYLPRIDKSSRLYKPLIIFFLKKWKEKRATSEIVPIT
jgi:hypothetical protein